MITRLESAQTTAKGGIPRTIHKETEVNLINMEVHGRCDRDLLIYCIINLRPTVVEPSMTKNKRTRFILLK